MRVKLSCCAFLGGDGETRTLAPVSQPTPLAGAPRHQLEYISRWNVLTVLIHFFSGWNVAERKGFEPLALFESLVFKTSSLNRSDTSPSVTQIILT